ncbi:MAG: hypothetical protein ABI847_13885 [Anaerolineales bacterium]
MTTPTWKRPFDYYLLWIAVIVSLGINVYLIRIMQQARQQVGLAASSAALAVDGLRTTALDYTVPIRETLPVSFTVSYRQNVTVPISTTIPINVLITVPLKTPIGTFPIDVPVVTDLPINLQPTIPLSLSVPVSVSVPIAVDVPIHIDLSQTALNESLLGAKQYLNDVAAGLGVTPGTVPPATQVTPE